MHILRSGHLVVCFFLHFSIVSWINEMKSQFNQKSTIRSDLFEKLKSVTPKCLLLILGLLEIHEEKLFAFCRLRENQGIRFGVAS